MTTTAEEAPPIAEPIVITEPGVYEIPEDVYHADPVPGGSLSSSGAKLLLPPSCPAKFDYARKHGRKPTEAMEFGSAAHKLLLGEGAEMVVVDAADWRTKAAQAARDEARSRGAIPVLPKQVAEIEAMVAALRAHPLASVLFDRQHGKPEQSLFWRDQASGVMRRARLDWLPESRPGKPTIFVDFKSTASASPSSLPKHVATYAYYCQAAWYLDGILALGLAEQPVFWFVFQEKEAPYLVTVAEVAAKDIAIGREKNRDAITTYARCTAANRWPGYSDGPVVVSLPSWVEIEHEASRNGSDVW